MGLSGSTVGIIGLGGIGAAVAKRLKGFDCEVVYHSRTRKPEIEEEHGVKYVDMDELLAVSDFVTIHSAPTPETANMADAEFFKKMKNTAVFVNTSPGGLVNQEDLYEALRGGEIYAAGLDVTVPEPLPTDHPLFNLSNCLILPHIGSASVATRDRLADIAANNIVDMLNR